MNADGVGNTVRAGDDLSRPMAAAGDRQKSALIDGGHGGWTPDRGVGVDRRHRENSFSTTTTTGGPGDRCCPSAHTSAKSAADFVDRRFPRNSERSIDSDRHDDDDAFESFPTATLGRCGRCSVRTTTGHRDEDGQGRPSERRLRLVPFQLDVHAVAASTSSPSGYGSSSPALTRFQRSLDVAVVLGCFAAKLNEKPWLLTPVTRSETEC